MKSFWKAQISEINILCENGSDHEDSANGTWLPSVFVESFLCGPPKCTLANFQRGDPMKSF